jgi:hypothetical protein
MSEGWNARTPPASLPMLGAEGTSYASEGFVGNRELERNQENASALADLGAAGGYANKEPS